MMRRKPPLLASVALLFAFFTIAPAECAATPWSELEAGTIVKLRQPLLLEEGYRLKKGGALALHQIRFLEPIQVEALSMRYFPCPRSFADKKAALQILEEKYGFEMDLNCEITVFVEFKDFYLDSLFENSSR
ncbi:hypothetical protein EB061_07110 [bacterium]|jgi:hypothetical protein|nr:hypothetical protein [bacterium]